VDQTYEHIVTGDLSIIKHLDLQNIMKMGAKFCLSYRIKPADILRGLKNDLNLFIDKWCKKEKITKDRFQNWINLILTSVRNSMYRINPNILKKIQYFIMQI
jgi:predicted nucleic acid-binding protein